MGSASALKLSLLASGHSDMGSVACISGEGRVSDQEFRTPSTTQRRNGARALSKSTAMQAASDGISRCSKAIIASQWALG